MLNTKLLGSVSAGPSEFIDDVFSTYLYTGNATARSITNGIDLAGEGGLVWTKSRSLSGSDHYLVDTARGNTRFLNTNSVAAQTNTSDITAFNNDGYSLNADVNGGWNNNGATFCSWTFRKAPKFFDVVTYTGNGSSSQTIAHNLGSQPGFIILKQTSGTSDWQAFARKDATNYSFLQLNQTGAALGDVVQSDLATSSVIKVGWLGTTWLDFNTNGQTYVAYIFAHNAGGFGAAGTDNVISCGSYTGTGAAGNAITLGYEPQYLLLKRTDSIGNWVLIDNMRGFPVGSDDARLQPNLSDAEVTQSSFAPTATGFVSKSATFNGSGHTYIYMAIRRPMKPPTSGTQVFSPVATTASTGTKLTTNFPIDLQISNYRPYGSNPAYFVDRLRGASSTDTDGGVALTSTSTAAEVTSPQLARAWDNTGFKLPGYYGGADDIFWNFRRAPGFFDIVCYTGTGSARTVAHNLGAVPELMIVKSRNSAYEWSVYSSALGNTKFLFLQSTGAAQTGSGWWNNTSPTSSVFTVNTDISVNESAKTYVAYLFATLAGVSKVFSFTGNGSSQTINCGFTAGARLVLIKRTDSTGDWYIWDTARGIVSGNDPHLSLNTTAAEVTSNDSIDPDNSGFIVNQLSATNINVSSATYIGLAIA